MSRRFLNAVLVVIVCTHLAGCAENKMRRQLEKVAKDWCMVMRASQVVPVYPLTEDLQPGDVFLVQAPVKDQVKVYEKRGFLPLDQMVTRLGSLTYKEFYGDAYWKGTYGETPHERAARAAGDQKLVTVRAPAAGFPTYSIEVQEAGGLKMAVPVKGVPVGVSLLGADRASASITISDAYTYACDWEQLLGALDTWWNADPRPRVKDDLLEIRDGMCEDQPLYLRVVSRVYLTGRVIVTVVNTDVSGFGVDVGAAKPVTLLELDDRAAENYRRVVAAMSETINEGKPGGSLRVVAATHRSVTMDETFDRPLAVGYIGFDVPVLADGSLGTPVTTLGLLERTVEPAPRVVAGGLTHAQRQVKWRRLEIMSRPDPLKQLAIVVRAARGLPTAYVGEFLDEVRRGTRQPDWLVDKFWEVAGRYSSDSARKARVLVRELDDALRKEK